MSRPVLPLMFVLFAAGVAAQPSRPTLAIPEVRVVPGVSKDSASSLNGIISAEASRSPHYKALSASEMAALIGIERQKQLLGCADDETSCLAELAGALGAAYFFDAELSRPGDRFLLVLRVMKPQENLILGRVAYYSELSDQALAKAARRGTRLLVGLTPKELELRPRDEEPSFVSAGRGAPPWIATGAAALALGGAGVFGGMAFSNRAALSRSVSGESSSLTFPQAQSLSADANRNITVAAVSAGVGAALTAVAVWLWTREDL